ATHEEMERQIHLGLVEFRDDHTEPPFRKAHLIPVLDELYDYSSGDFEEASPEEEEVGLQVMPSVIYKQAQVSVRYLRALLGDKIFNNPKDHEVLARLIGYCLGNDDSSVVMDFFAGSASTAEAVLALNQRDGGSRKIVAIQLPEPCEEKSAAQKAGYRTIADIGRERIRRVIEKIKAEADLVTPVPADLGFKSFVLAPSNFKQWRGDGIETGEELARQIELFVKAEKDGARTEDVLFELLLKFGQPLTTPIEALEVAGQRVFAIDGRSMVFLLEGFGLDTIEPLLALKPREVVALDSVFHNSDELKSNLDLACRDAEVTFTCL
ncbi:MAG: site-specific DNA-methyltransferase, partial [Deltaproteobacteria bacterium]|nr:site-specific DNA-methyltransferase [Deltaproteobacteria bacterium]